MAPPPDPSPSQCYLWAIPGPSVPVCCTLFGPSTSASAGPGEVASLGHCLQNTNSLGTSVWGGVERPEGRRYELLPWWGWGGVGSYLIGCQVSQSPAPETWSLFDFELLMALSKVKSSRTGPTPPPPVPLSVSPPGLSRPSFSSFSGPQKAKQMGGKLVVSPSPPPVLFS